MSYTVYHYLWQVRKLSDNTYPVKLVVNIDGVRKNYKTNYSYTVDDWDRLNGAKLRDLDLQEEKKHLENQIKEVKAILADIEYPTHPAFEKKYNQKRLKKNQLVRFWFLKYIADLEFRNKPISSIKLMHTVINSLELFKPNLKFQEITKNFLEDYEAWMLSKNPNARTTIGIYLTHLRVIFNYAIREGIIPRELYPFGKQTGGYVIKQTRNRKPSLNLGQIQRLISYKCDTPENEFARDMWVLLYLLNGMNVIDLCRLRYKNIDFKNHYFYYNRTKTRETKPISVLIDGGLNPVAEEIIRKYGNKDHTPENYVFPFLEKLKGKEMTMLKDEFYIKNDLIKRINLNLKPFKKKLKIDFGLTVKIARHSYASVLHYELHYPIPMVGDGLGHSGIQVTQHYLSGANTAERKKMNFDLLPQKTNKKPQNETIRKNRTS
ncbi:MAG: site-specific integrase [Bacteroidetes bacterium]|nr:site-specific integrase [Bacteroidota bacterium]